MVTDKQIGQALNLTAEGQGLEADYTLIYFASPHEPSRSYEGDFSDSPAVQMELRRRSDVVLGRADDAKNITNAPLFVKYQFFTPGEWFRVFPRITCRPERNRLLTST